MGLDLSKSRPYRAGPVQRAIIDAKVKALEDSEVISCAASPWSSPILLVWKKDSTWRVMVDLQHFHLLIDEQFPLPRVDDSLMNSGIVSPLWFSRLDLLNVFLLNRIE